jgi:hypothetical protein
VFSSESDQTGKMPRTPRKQDIVTTLSRFIARWAGNSRRACNNPPLPHICARTGADIPRQQLDDVADRVGNHKHLLVSARGVGREQKEPVAGGVVIECSADRHLAVFESDLESAAGKGASEGFLFVYLASKGFTKKRVFKSRSRITVGSSLRRCGLNEPEIERGPRGKFCVVSISTRPSRNRHRADVSRGQPRGNRRLPRCGSIRRVCVGRGFDK